MGAEHARDRPIVGRQILRVLVPVVFLVVFVVIASVHLAIGVEHHPPEDPLHDRVIPAQAGRRQGLPP